jgi:carboxymethylenebutenolidase
MTHRRSRREVNIVSRDVDLIELLPDRELGTCLLLHEGWGRTADVLAAGERLAAAGFRTLVPDLFSAGIGVGAAVTQLVRGRGTVIDVVDGLIDWASGVGDGLTVIGFSMGAALAHRADRHEGCLAMSVNYGFVPAWADPEGTTPIVASYGAKDPLLRRGIDPIREVCGVRPHDLEIYHGAGHSFMTEPGPGTMLDRGLRRGSHPWAAADAWRRTLDFLALHMGASTEPNGELAR